MRCHVEMYGLPEKATKLRQVEITLSDNPCLSETIAALRHEIPSLEGEVIRSGEDRLTDGYTLNINGKFYTDYSDNQGDSELFLTDGDRIALLPLSPGG